MALMAYGTFQKEPSPDLIDRVRRYLGDSGLRWDIGDGGDQFVEAYRIIRAHDNDLRSYGVTILDDPKVYPDDRKQVVGYVLSPKDYRCVRNPDADFLRPQVGPCETLLTDEAVPDITESPKGRLLAVADDLIIHDDLWPYLASDGLEAVKPVRYLGKPLEKWKRLEIRSRQPVLDELVFVSIRCALCGQPLVATLSDLWLAAKNVPVENVCCDTQGRGHFGEEPCLVAGTKVIERLRKDKKLRGSGVNVSPIYGPETERYRVVARIRRAMAR